MFEETMKENIWKLLTDHAKWVFSGIGVFFITLIINSTCSNGAEDKNHTVTNISGGHVSGVVNSGVITYGDKIDSGDKVSGDKVLGDKVSGDKVLGDKHTIYNPPPSFRDVTVARGENGNPVGIADNPSPVQTATNLLAKVMRGDR